MNKDDFPLIGIEEMARILEIPDADLRKLVNESSIPCIRLGKRTVRFEKSRVLEWYGLQHGENFNPVEETKFASIKEIQFPSSLPHLRKKRKSVLPIFRAEEIEKAFDMSMVSDSPCPSEFVYFIRSDQYTKIGVSVNPLLRINELQTGNPVKLTIDALIPIDRQSVYGPGASRVESSLHNLFSDYCVRSEWFTLNGVIGDDFYSKYSPTLWGIDERGRIRRKP